MATYSDILTYTYPILKVWAGWAAVGAREGPRRALRAPSRGDAFCTFLHVCAALHACVGAWKAPRSAPEVPPLLYCRGMRGGGRPEFFSILDGQM